ncbi:MAG: SURF1 family protein [Gammaproteobacteria bacterium]
MPARRYRAVVAYGLFFICLSLLLSLGIWQGRRGLEKAADERARASPHYITLERAPPDWRGIEHRRVRMRGDWLAPVFLLDNRVHRGRLGYEVLALFQLAGDRAMLLVNRGWVGRADAPGVAAVRAPAHVMGELRLPEKGFTLGPAYRAQPGWPKVIQYFDAAALSAVLAREDGVDSALQPAVLALDAAHPAAFARISRPREFGAARHFGYAVQWWGLAATLLVFGVIWRRRATRPRA